MTMPKTETVKRLEQQVDMVKRDFTKWMLGEISDKNYSFKMSNHLASFSEILKDKEE